MKVLVCPLDWGIGHATRCIPVIRKFMKQGYEVVIAADGRPLELLKKEFPNCRFIRYRGIRITYPMGRALLLGMILHSPVMFYGYFREHRELKKILDAERPDLIFSDNRYGARSKRCYSIFMTHQLRIIFPKPVRFITGMVERLIRRFMKRFDECWIPDFEFHQGLAGQLSHPSYVLPNTHYIGTLSRFSAPATHADAPLPPDHSIMVSLSGPEPQRTIFEKMIFEQLKDSGLSGIIVRGLTERTDEWDLTDRIHVYSHLPADQMKEHILRSQIIICRSGYSSLMDLVTLGKKAILIPTPGQPEQEYLARFLMEKKIYFSMHQYHFDLLYAIEMTRNYPGLVMMNDYRILEERIREVTSKRISRPAV
ncbi:MAG: glycosyltransferase [Bacteroidetes bacterium]|nr:glycosyltransferase [Bacteroidota bacterium]